MKRRSLVAVLAAGSLVLAACGDDDDAADEPSEDATADTGAEAPAEGGIPQDWPDKLVFTLTPSDEAGGLIETAEKAAEMTSAWFKVQEDRLSLLKKTAKKIGKEIANQLAFTVGGDYKVKGDGAKVTVKAKNKKAAPFWLGIENQQLTGVAVMITKG